MCDDENIEPIEESELANYFGDNVTGAGYVMFYQAVNLDLKSLGLKKEPKPRSLPPAPRVAAVVEEGVVNGGPARAASPLDRRTPSPLFMATPASPTKTHSVPLSVPASKTDGALDVPALPRRGSSGVSRDTSPSNRWSRHESSGPISHSPGAGERGKWFSLKKKEGSAGPSDVRLLRQATTTTETTTSASTDSADMPILQPDNRKPHSSYDTANHVDLSASMSQASTSSSAGHSPLPPLPNGSAAGSAPVNGSGYPAGDASGAAAPAQSLPPKPATGSTNGNANAAGDRTSRIGRSATASRLDRASNGNGNGMNAGQNGYAGGSGLGRKLSGATGLSSLARRSSNAFKIGFGKKKVGDEQGL